jgi:hypothetical protein
MQLRGSCNKNAQSYLDLAGIAITKTCEHARSIGSQSRGSAPHVILLKKME